MTNKKETLSQEVDKILEERITDILEKKIMQFAPVRNYAKKKQKGEIGRIYGKTLFLK
jgi:thymidylate synthase